jgi:cytoskeletal protein RodZ
VPRASSGPRPQAAPAAVDDTPSAEEAAEIAASTVFEPDAPDDGSGAEIELEVALDEAGSAEPAEMASTSAPDGAGDDA